MKAAPPQAVIDRIKELGQVLEDRERIVHEAIAHLEGESERLQDGEQLIRKRLGTNKAEIGRLIEVLKSMGAKGLVSVQDELERLESEAKELKQQLKDLSQQQAPVERITDQARKFVETWEDIGELIDEATAEECKELLQHYIEVIELHSTDPKGRTGTYALRLFPEVRPDRDFTWNQADPSEFLPKPTLSTKNGDDAPQDAIAVLTSDDVLFERSSGKLPRQDSNYTKKHREKRRFQNRAAQNPAQLAPIWSCRTKDCGWLSAHGRVCRRPRRKISWRWFGRQRGTENDHTKIAGILGGLRRLMVEANVKQTSSKRQANLPEAFRKPFGSLSEAFRKPFGSLSEAFRKPPGRI